MWEQFVQENHVVNKEKSKRNITIQCHSPLVISTSFYQTTPSSFFSRSDPPSKT